MCLAIPAKILSVDGCTAHCEMSGVTKDIDISLTPGAAPGDWVIVPAGAQNRETRVRVEEVEYFREDELPMPLERVKRVLRRCERRKEL